MEEGNFIQINDNYRIRADSLNLVLMEKYERKEGKGKYAKGLGEYDFRDLSYHGSFETLVKSMIRHEQLKAVQEVDTLEKVVSYIKDVEKSIIKHLNEKVTLVRK